MKRSRRVSRTWHLFEEIKLGVGLVPWEKTSSMSPRFPPIDKAKNVVVNNSVVCLLCFLYKRRDGRRRDVEKTAAKSQQSVWLHFVGRPSCLWCRFVLAIDPIQLPQNGPLLAKLADVFCRVSHHDTECVIVCKKCRCTRNQIIKSKLCSNEQKKGVCLSKSILDVQITSDICGWA